MPDDRLHDQSSQGRGQPKNRYLVGACPQVFVDGAHIGHLQSPAELDAQKAEAHVPDLPESQPRFIGHKWTPCLSTVARSRESASPRQSASASYRWAPPAYSCEPRCPARARPVVGIAPCAPPMPLRCG